MSRPGAAPGEPAGERERALVLACVRTALDDEVDGLDERSVGQDVDWDHLLELARLDGVTPLVHRGLRGRADLVPDDALDTLRERARTTATRNLLSARELCAIVGELEGAGVRALPFKGPTLAVAAYDDLGLRTFADLDLLVPEGALTPAVDRLEGMGYAWSADAPRLDDAAIRGGRFTPPLSPEYQLLRDGRCVEVRCGVGQRSMPLHLGFEELWDGRDAVALAGTSVPCLDPRDRLLVLAYHGVKHRWARLKWVCDVAATLAAADGLDWDALLERAGAVGARRRLLVALGLAVELVDADVPERVGEATRDDPLAPWLTGRVLDRRRFLPPAHHRDVPGIWYNVLASDTLGDAAAPLVHAPYYTPGLAEYRVKPLPGPLHPVYYPLRPLRGLAVTLRRVLRG